MEVSWEYPRDPVWSPDGKAFAYDARVAGVRQVFIRYPNSPTPVQLTQRNTDVTAVGWSPDGKRVISMGNNPGAKEPPNALFSTPVFGGESELLLTADIDYAAVSRDGKALAAIIEEDGKRVVKASSPIGAPFQRYAPAPFETKEIFQQVNLRFSPDGRRILLLVDEFQGRLAWNLPWPPAREIPRQIPLRLPFYGRTPFFTWLPDSRHIIFSLQDKPDLEYEHLWIADVESGTRRQITTGASSERNPALSPDGKKLLLVRIHQDNAFVSLSLENAVAERMASSELRADMPAWAMRRQQFAYVTTRNGQPEIWVRGDGRDQPVVTSESFPAGTTNLLINPALSPDADRLIYTRFEANGPAFIWISSVSGGPPVRLTNDSNASELGGSWSPEGKSFAYLQYLNGRLDVMFVKTTGEAQPVLLRPNIGMALPQWSPDGQWIKFREHEGGKGWTLISQYGKTERALGLSDAIEMTFSNDSSRLFGIQPEQGRRRLFSFDLATMKVKTIGELARDFIPQAGLNPGMRLSLAPASCIRYYESAAACGCWKATSDSGARTPKPYAGWGWTAERVLSGPRGTCWGTRAAQGAAQGGYPRTWGYPPARGGIPSSPS